LKDSWESSSPYELFMGRWSRLAAELFIEQFDWQRQQDWLDVGCGTGAMSRVVLERCEAKNLIGVDPSAEFVGHAQKYLGSERAQFSLGDAEALDQETQSIDRCVSAFVLNFVPDTSKSLMEMKRVLRPEGRIGILLWDYAAGMGMLRKFWDAAIEIQPAAQELDEGVRFPICREGALAELCEELGFQDVQSRALDIECNFESFDDYWTPFEGKVGPAPSFMESLKADESEALKEKLRESLAIEADGSIRLISRAWAVSAVAR